MSLQEERPRSAPATSVNHRGHPVLVTVGCLFVLACAGQISFQQYFLRNDGYGDTFVFENTEQINKLRAVEFVETAQANNDWPQWRGPRRDGVSGATGLITTFPAGGPRVLWEAQVGRGFAAPVVAGGLVYALFLHEDQENVVCWKAADGEELWRFRYPAAYRNSFGDGPRSTPTIDGEVLYAVGGTGIMHCLRTHPKTTQGEVVWRKDLLAEFGAPNLKWGVSFSPLVAGERVIINPGGPGGNSIAALEKRSGDLLWKNLDDQASYSSPIAVTLAGREQIVFLTAQNLVGVTPDTGEVLWRFPWVTNAEGCNIATPVVAQDYIFVSSGYGKGCGLVKIAKTPTGYMPLKVYENAKMRNHFSSSVRFKDNVYGFNEEILTCLDLRTGNIRWKERGLGKGSLTIADGQLVLLGDNGTLALAEATGDGYRETARWDTGLTPACWTVPVIADGKMYLRDQQKIMCVQMRQ